MVVVCCLLCVVVVVTIANGNLVCMYVRVCGMWDVGFEILLRNGSETWVCRKTLSVVGQNMCISLIQSIEQFINSHCQ